MAVRTGQGAGTVHILVALCLVLLSTAGCSKKENSGQEPRYLFRERISHGVFRITGAQRTTQILNAGRRIISSGPKSVETEATLTVSQADAEGLYHATFQIDRVRMSSRGIIVDTNEPEPRPKERKMWMAIPEPTNARKEGRANESEPCSPDKKGWVAIPEPTASTKGENAKLELYTLAKSFTNAPVNLVFDANMTLIETNSTVHEKVMDASAEVKEVFEQVGLNLDKRFTDAVVTSFRKMLPKDKAGIGALWRFTVIRDFFGGQIEWLYTGELKQIVEQDGSKIAHIAFRGSAKDKHRRTVKLRGNTVTVNRIKSNASGTFEFDIGLGSGRRMILESNAKFWMTGKSQQFRCDTAQKMTITFTKLR